MDTYLKNMGSSSSRKNDYMLADSYEIDEFNPVDLNEITGGIVAIIAGTGAGKTVLLKDIISKTYKKYNEMHLFSRTAKLQKAYDFFPRRWISDDFDEKKIEEIWDKQIDCHTKGHKMENILVILDDIISSPSYKKSKMLDELAIAGRQLNITVILLSQHFTSIRPIIRNNIRVAITFQMSSKKERDKFVEQFLSVESSRSGDILFRRITDKKYQCLIVQVYKCGESISAKVKKYTADPNVIIDLKDEEPERIIGSKKLIRRIIKRK